MTGHKTIALCARVGAEEFPVQYWGPGYRFELFNPGIAGGWVPITNWISAAFVDGWISYLKSKYRPVSILGLLQIGWGPTIRLMNDMYGPDHPIALYQNKIGKFPKPIGPHLSYSGPIPLAPGAPIEPSP